MVYRFIPMSKKMKVAMYNIKIKLYIPEKLEKQ